MTEVYGPENSPVPHDPLDIIDEISFPSYADFVIVRSGNFLPDGDMGAGRNIVFSPTRPAKDETKDPVEQADAHKDQYYVGAFTDSTNVDPDPPGGPYYNTPERPPNRPWVEGVIAGQLATPSSTEVGDRTTNYNNGGFYLWHTGRAVTTTQVGVQCCIINTRKMRYDFRKIGNKKARPGSTQYRDVFPSNMSIKCFYQGTFTSAPDLMCEFAAYKMTDPEDSGSFFLTETGHCYGNSMRKIARSVIRVTQTVLLPEVIWTYNFKKTIEVDGGVELTEAELVPFEAQPGG